ncbi:hypothetical protein AT6N2_C1612 [Agrobacterium tumefaciens]|nr:hypothetical protein AT6N2_C1612 [Agrobacterium tumefaciens]
MRRFQFGSLAVVVYGGLFYRLSSGAASSEICISDHNSTKRILFPIRGISRFSFSPLSRATTSLRAASLLA